MSILSRINEHIDKIYSHGLYPPDAAYHWSSEIKNFVNQIDRKLKQISVNQIHIDKINEKYRELTNLLENVIEPFISNPCTDTRSLSTVYRRLKHALDKLKNILEHLT